MLAEGAGFDTDGALGLAEGATAEGATGAAPPMHAMHAKKVAALTATNTVNRPFARDMCSSALPRGLRSASIEPMIRGRTGFVLALLCVGTTLALSPSAVAKSYIDDYDEPPPPPTPTATVASTSLAGMFGMPSLSMALKSPDAKVRAAAVMRAAEVAANVSEVAARDDAWRLVEGATLDGGDDLDGSLRVRLAAARALAGDPRREGRAPLETLLTAPEPPRKVVSTVPTWSPGGWGPPPWGPPAAPPPKAIKPASPELVRFVRETAAMALGVRGDHETLLLRARARDSAESSRAALGALFAYPPVSLSPITPKGEGVWPRETLDLLVRLGDARGADPLLRACSGNDDLTAATALVGLSRLADGRAVTVARAVTKDSRPELRIAAAEALAELGEPFAEGAILALIADEKTTAEGKRLALRHPSAGLVPDLDKVARAGDPQAIGALGRVGAAALPVLAAIAREDSLPAGLADIAAHQLAVSPLDGAGKAISELLDGASPARRRRAVRAGAVFAARHGGAPSGIASVAKELASASLPEDRAAGTLLLAVVDVGRARDALKSDDPVRRRAAIAGLSAHAIAEGADVARAHLEAHGTTEPEDLVQALAAIAVRAVDGTVARDVPVSTTVLARWLSEDGAAAPLAAYLLAARGGELARAHVVRALASDSLDVRVAALLGLGLSPDKTATGELSARAVDSPNVVLRRAAMRAIAARGDDSSRPALELARRLDPDPEVRALAKLAKPGVHGASLLTGREVAQAKVTLSKGVSAVAILASADGLVLPFVVDPEGFVVMFRVASGPARLEVRPISVAAAPAPAKSAKP